MSLVELLVATMVTSAVSAGVLGTLRQSQSAFRWQSEAADVRQRLRVGVDTLTRDLMVATAAIPAPGRITLVQGPARHTYYRDVNALQLRHDDGQGTDLPVLDQVTELAFAEEGAVAGQRHIRVRLAVAGLRAEFVVAPRNINIWR
jgi:hypothetical protein